MPAVLEERMLDETIAALIASPEAFRQWLRAQIAEDTLVGYADNSNACPLALWLQEAMSDDMQDNEWLEVRRERLVWRSGEMPLPGWMRRFVAVVDGGYVRDMDISATAALRLLDAALREDFATSG